MPQIALPALEAIISLSRCEGPFPVPVVTTAAPVREEQSLYLSAREYLYAVHAADGTARWCQQVALTRTREVRDHPGVSYPPPPRMAFAAPRVVGGASGVNGYNGVVYVCIGGFGEYTCAFDADDGSLRWWTPTDARVISMPFMDWAVPLVHDGIVYSGTYALNEPDGSVRWHIEAIDTSMEGALALHALVDGMLYATTHRGIYAINAQSGQIRWLYHHKKQGMVNAPPVVSGHLLYMSTSYSFGYPEKYLLWALDVETGKEVWRYLMGRVIGAVVHHETIYVSSGDRYLYALDKQSGSLRWQHQFAATSRYSATIADGVVYITVDGAYALSSEDGAVLWHQPLGSNPGVSFGQPVVLDGAVYLVRLDKRAHGVLFALDTRTGAECWQTPYPTGGALLAVASNPM